MKLGIAWLLVLGLSAVVGCGGGTTSAPDASGGDAGTGPVDGGSAEDTGAGDAGATGDAGPRSDAGAGEDTGLASDAALPDTGPRPDAGMCVDLPAEATRPAPVQCSPCRPPGGATGGGSGSCATDADCTAGDNGRCVFGRIGPFCDYDTCFGDGDCATNEVCLCDASNGGGNACVSADCHVDADCGAGHACSPTLGTCGHYTGFVAYRCHVAADTCTTDADCTAGSSPGYCAFDELAGHWACSTTECAG